MRLIDADELKNDHNMGDECDKCGTKWKECQYDYIYSKMDFCTWIDYAPTIEAVKVVRCKDCKHWNADAIGICKLHDIRPTPIIKDNWFCADAERKEE